ncbi:MAG TPA: NADPH:quinone reductase [Burkholderiales bacterium]|nr:NADPH:quinone reductase [Burkholderiales bacterium]
MKAGWYEQNGPAKDVLKIGERPDPEPGPDEVRVRVACSGVNPSDVKRRAGWNNQKIAFPWVVPDNDGAGVIDRVGAGVDARRVGERVWLHSTGWKRPLGTAAQYTVTPHHRAFPLPAGASFEVGAGLGVPAMTAHRAVFGPGPVRGRTVLVTGGAGAVGFYAIQLAKWGGARVVTTVSGAQKAAEAKRAGADHVVNYRTENAAERVLALTGGAGVDHIVEVDFGANLATTLAVLKPNGSIATYASMAKTEPAIPFYALMFKNVRLLWVFVYEMPQGAMTDAGRDVNAWLASRTAVHPRQHLFPLDRLADAHIAVEEGAVGKVIVQLPPV